MYRSFVVFGLYLSFAIAVGAACGPAPLETPSDDDDDSGPRGGTTGSGGTTGGTGNTNTGGTGNFGTTGGTGNVGTGGTGNVGTGGVSTGGTSNAGRSNGGSPAGAGRAAGGSAGAATGTGGTVATGGTGAGATGGTVGAAGTATTGGAGTGSSTTCDTTFKVDSKGFVRMPGKGGTTCYSGYAFAGGDKTSTVTFPGGGTDFSMSMGVLNIKGTVGAATEENKYVGNVYFGFNIAQIAGGTKTTVKPTGSSLTVTCTGCATPAMRVQLVGASQWCAPLMSGTAITYASFKTNCWEGGTPQTAYDMSPLESIQITIPGTATDATYDFTLTSVTEG